MKNFQLNKFQIVLLVLGLTAIFLLIYSPSFTVPFPGHPDEWHHISQALNLQQGEYQWRGLPTFGFGFHLFLYGINQLADLIQMYQFLAPTWAVLSALILFFVTYSLSGQNFLTAFLTIIFFSSIKSNINLLGLYFFTPLTFAIPFIFLFIFFFVRGLEKENKKYLLLSFLIMLLLVFTHAISATFAFPILFFSAALYYKYIKKEFRFFLIFLLIPLMGVFFYAFVVNLTIIESFGILAKGIWFPEDYQKGVFNDSLTVTYSIVGGILAGIGFLAILWKKKKYLYPYIFWPLYLLVSIWIFRMTDISYLSPYHRNFYYFTISLPLLSALGLNWIINFVASRLKMVNFNFIAIPILVIAMSFSFISYREEVFGRTPHYIKVITIDDYQDLLFLAEFPRANILASYPLSLTVAPITGHEIIADSSDRFGLKHVLEFFYDDNGDCCFRDAIIRIYNVDYIVSPHEILCEYKLLRSEHNYIYQVSD